MFDSFRDLWRAHRFRAILALAGAAAFAAVLVLATHYLFAAKVNPDQFIGQCVSAITDGREVPCNQPNAGVIRGREIGQTGVCVSNTGRANGVYVQTYDGLAWCVQITRRSPTPTPGLRGRP